MSVCRGAADTLSAADIPPSTDTPRSTPKLFVLALLALLGFSGLTALGRWQLERRVWKLELIERVDQRIHATPTPAPGSERWSSIDAANAEYRHVHVTGRFLHERETLVRAATQYGSGFWVLTPFQTREGFTVLINRGFVPPERRDASTRAADQVEGETTVTGLLRLTEPKGAFLHANDVAGNRWYSRDVEAISAARGLAQAAPYFIDAEPATAPGDLPIAGLTVVSFRNSHLQYALTWFGLALMVAGWAVLAGRHEWRLRHRHSAV